MSNILLNLNTVVSFLCLLMATHLFWQRAYYQLPIKLLAYCFLTLGLHAMFLSLTVSARIINLSAALQPAMPLLFAPLSYLLFQSARNPNFQLRSIHLFNLIPAIIVFVLMLTKQLMMLVDFVVLSTLFIYAALLSYLAMQGSKQFELCYQGNSSGSDSLHKTVYLWLLVFTGYAWFSFLSDTLIFLEVRTGKATIESIALLSTITFKLVIISWTMFFALQKSHHFDRVYVALAAINEKDIAPEIAEHYEQIISSFEEQIKDHTAYTQEVLSLKTMADRLGVPARRFSNAINNQYGESYSKYMNRLRVKYAEKLLRDNPDLSITAVMYDSGFRTKSSFNREFKAINGVSPTTFRQ